MKLNIASAGPSVSLAMSAGGYPAAAPYHPSERYPELVPRGSAPISTVANPVYAAVRESLQLLGLDGARYGTAEWNPLGGIIRRGAAVVVKPNWVYHLHPGDPAPAESMITHPAVLRAVLDYVYLACGPSGRVTLGDAPIQSADFQRILELSCVEALVGHFRRQHGFEVTVADFRCDLAVYTKNGQIVQSANRQPDPRGYKVVELGEKSALCDVDQHWKQFRSLDYDEAEMREHHRPGTHRYLVSGSVLEADVLVNVPKLKTHGKSGLTCSLKNLVGINGNKAYLPHFRTGAPGHSGDEYPIASVISRTRSMVRNRLILSNYQAIWRLTRSLGRGIMTLNEKSQPRSAVGGTSPHHIFGGHWYGNDTTWRMVLDLNLLLFFGGPTGCIETERQRGYVSIVDGIVAGEGNGPLLPKRRQIGAILAGTSPVAIDLVAAHCMGFDWRRIPLLAEAARRLGTNFPAPGHDVPIVQLAEGPQALDALDIDWAFRPPDGWIGHMERTGKPTSTAHSA